MWRHSFAAVCTLFLIATVLLLSPLNRHDAANAQANPCNPSVQRC